MKKLLMAVVLGTAGLLATGAYAQTTVSDTFDVDINLTPVCTVAMVDNVQFDYVSNQAGAQPSTGGNFTVTCTQGASYTFSLLHNFTGVAPVWPVVDATTTLQYDLTLPVAAAGTGGVQNYQLAGNMNAGQAGVCPNPACDNSGSGNKMFTLQVTY